MIERIYQYRDYADYLDTQREISLKRKHITVGRQSRPQAWIRDAYPDLNRVLCVGARDVSEVKRFTDAGYDALGIDLHSDTDSIIVCDMSSIPECPKLHGKQFDIAFCSHSLEHCLDFEGFYKGLLYLQVKVVYAECPLIRHVDKRECHVYPWMTTQDPEFAISESFPDFSIRKVCTRGKRILFVVERGIAKPGRGSLK